MTTYQYAAIAGARFSANKDIVVSHPIAEAMPGSHAYPLLVLELVRSAGSA